MVHCYKNKFSKKRGENSIEAFFYSTRGGGGEVEPVAARAVVVVVGAAVWVAKAVEVVEVRWSELPPRPRYAFLALAQASGHSHTAFYA
jgi:hypothetical protein